MRKRKCVMASMTSGGAKEKMRLAYLDTTLEESDLFVAPRTSRWARRGWKGRGEGRAKEATNEPRMNML